MYGRRLAHSCFFLLTVPCPALVGIWGTKEIYLSKFNPALLKPRYTCILLWNFLFFLQVRKGCRHRSRFSGPGSLCQCR
jgi:hypothetical protein